MSIILLWDIMEAAVAAVLIILLSGLVVILGAYFNFSLIWFILFAGYLAVKIILRSWDQLAATSICGC